MKKWKPFLILTLVLCFLSKDQTTAQNLQCGTEVTQQDWEQALEDRSASQNFDRSTFSQMLSIVPLEIHIVRRSDGTGGLDPLVLFDALVQLNEYYENANLGFNICDDLNYIDDDDLYDFSTSDSDALVDMYNVANRANIYFVGSLLNSNGESLAGNSSYPWTPRKRILIKNSEVDNGSTLLHEMGHFFGLFHTHDDYDGAELVDQSNCEDAGDGFCDTPADPNLYQQVDVNCNYIGTAVDANGDTYNPDTHNIMSYAPDFCRNQFSPEQYDHIAFSYLEYYQGFACNPVFSNLTTVSGSASLSWSSTVVTINTTIENDGQGFANSSTIGFYASTNTSFGLGDYLIGTATVSSLGLGESVDINFVQDLTTVSPSLPGGNYYIGYIIDYPNDVIELNENDNVLGWGIPGFYITVPAPICGPPSNLHETDLTCSTVTLNWNAVGIADAYQLAGRKAGGQIKVFEETDLTFRSFNGGLQPNTTYDWSVRTKCDGVWTGYASVKSFTTPTCKNSTYDETKDPFFVNENEGFLSEINLYPNPAKNNLNINFMSFSEKNTNVKVIDILGKTVLVEQIEVLQGENNFDLNVEDLQSGTYFVQINEAVQKFMVY